MSLERAINRLAEAVETLTRKLFPPIERPGLLTFRVTSERSTDMADKLKFVVSVPAAEGDVVRRALAVTLPDGSVQTSQLAGKDAAESDEFEVDQDSIVKVSVVNVDDAGNESEPRVAEFTIKDTIPPAQPGELTVRVTGEVPE